MERYRGIEDLELDLLETDRLPMSAITDPQS
jgi:hypothetical protein